MVMRAAVTAVFLALLVAKVFAHHKHAELVLEPEFYQKQRGESAGGVCHLVDQVEVAVHLQLQHLKQQAEHRRCGGDGCHLAKLHMVRHPEAQRIADIHQSAQQIHQKMRHLVGPWEGEHRRPNRVGRQRHIQQQRKCYRGGQADGGHPY